MRRVNIFQSFSPRYADDVLMLALCCFGSVILSLFSNVHLSHCHPPSLSLSPSYPLPLFLTFSLSVSPSTSLSLSLILRLTLYLTLSQHFPSPTFSLSAPLSKRTHTHAPSKSFFLNAKLIFSKYLHFKV